MNEFQEFYRTYRLKYYDNKKETKAIVTKYVSTLNFTLKATLIHIYEESNVWKEFDFFIYSLLIKGLENNVDIATVSWQLIKALATKEFVIVAMDIFETLSDQIDLTIFMVQFFTHFKHTQLDMSYYSYLLPSIKKCYGDKGLSIVEDSTNNYLYKLHAMRFYQRFSYSIFISSNEQHLNDEERELLFELICRRNEKTLEYEAEEIEFILKNVAHCNATFMNFKYFISHICVCSNRKLETNLSIFEALEYVWLTAFSKEDGDSVRKGVSIYRDVYDCLLKSDYKTLYTLTEADMFPPLAAPVFLMLETEMSFIVHSTAEVIKVLVRMLHTKYAHLINEAVWHYGIGVAMSNEDLDQFINSPEQDFMDGKVDTVIGTVLVRSEIGKEIWINSIFPTFVEFIHGEPKELDCTLFRCLKIAQHVIENATTEQKQIFHETSIKLIDHITREGGFTVNDKLCERLLVSAIELLVGLNQQLRVDEVQRLCFVLDYLEKGIFCNRRYVVSATGVLYRKYISAHFETHRAALIKYVEDIIDYKFKMTSPASNMRQSLEERTMVHEFCLATPRASQMEITLRMADKTMAYLERDIIDKRPYIYTMCALMEDATLKQHTHHYVCPLFKFCFREIEKNPESFSTRNAIYNLFTILIMRTLPYVDHYKNKTMDDVYALYGKFIDQFLRSFEDENLMTTRQRILMMLFFRRCNSEQPKDFIFTSATSKCRETLWQYFRKVGKRNEDCDMECEYAIKLWINIIPQAELQTVLDELLVSREFERWGFNSLLLKFRISEELIRKLEDVHKEKVLLRELQHALRVHAVVATTPDDMTGVPPPCIRIFNNKGWTYDRAIEVVCTVKSKLSEKLSAFEYLFDQYSNQNRVHEFMNTFFFTYLQLLLYITTDYYPLLSYFINSINIIIFCLDNFRDATYPPLTVPPEGLLMSAVCEFATYPSVLAFRVILFGRIDFFGPPNNRNVAPNTPNLLLRTFDKVRLKQDIIKGFFDFSVKVDDMTFDDAESLIIAFTHLNYILGVRHDFVLYLIGLRFLHTDLLKNTPFLVPIILRAFNVFRLTCGITCVPAIQAIRYLLSESFLDMYFRCRNRAADCKLVYIKWRQNDPNLNMYLDDNVTD